MEIVETSIYTSDIIKILSEDEYRELQDFLVSNPKSGNLIRGSGGLRKLRWKTTDIGKRGGVRNIYYYYENEHTLLMIYVYEKGKVEDLTPAQIKILKKKFLGE